MSLGSRFSLLQRIASGGMGTIHRGLDRDRSAPVAIKLLQHADPESVVRFDREAAVLAELRDPRIVEYVHHGCDDAGQPFLVMEWLDGEDLGRRLTRGPLTAPDARALAERIAGALAYAHTRGVVHRDVKPSNILLVGGRCDQAKLVDFGIARRRAATKATATGLAIGTPGYMAPEQVRGVRDIDARADVFALGCVLFEALAGRAAFAGDEPIAVLAKVLLDEPPSLASLVPGAPPDLVALVGRMLEKDRDRRPHDGADVVRLLHEPLVPEPSAPASAERAVVTVLAAKPREIALLDTLRQSADGPSPATGGSQIERLVDGTVLHVFHGAIASDQAMRAARLALSLSRDPAWAAIAIATGRAVVEGGRVPVSEVIDRVASGVSIGGAGVRVDALTAGLLEVRYEIGADARGHVLGRERSGAEPRKLLGKVSPCVGRDRDLAVLSASWDECAAEGSAGMVLVTAPAGVGKTRLSRELVARVASGDVPPIVIAATGNPLATTVPFAFVVEAIRGAAGILEGDALDVARRKLETRLARHVDEARIDRIAEIIADLAGVPRERPSDWLLALRLDPSSFADEVRRAVVAWLRAEAETQGLLLLLDDAQWADDASLAVVDEALRGIADRALLVVILARPEIVERRAQLFADRSALHLRLLPLGKRACEQLVQSVVTDLAPALVGRVVALSEGNAFFLEELIRAVARGDHDKLPETVLAIAHTRLSTLSENERRIVQAASVFGSAITREALRAVVPDLPVDDIASTLVEREIFEARDGEHLAFRHALLNEAAYAALTPDAAKSLHASAATFLEGKRDAPAGIVAEHFERAGERAQAAKWYRRAAVDAYRLDDSRAVMAASEAGIACGPSRDELSYFRSLQASVLWWSGDVAACERLGREALALATPRTALWYSAVSAVFGALVQLATDESWKSLAEELAEATPTLQTARRYTRAASIVATEVLHAGEKQLSRALLDRARFLLGGADVIATEERTREGALAIADQLEAWWLVMSNDPWNGLVLARSSLQRFDRAGHVRDPDWSRMIGAVACLHLGRVEEARTLRSVPNVTPLFRPSVIVNAGFMALEAGDVAEADRHGAVAVETVRDHTRWNRAMLAVALVVPARCAILRGELSRAMALLDEALPLVERLHAHASAIYSTRGLALMARGDHEGARTAIDAGVDAMERTGTAFLGELFVRLDEIEVRKGIGDREGADRAIDAGERYVSRVAASIDDASARAAFLDSARVRRLRALR